ncbi:MAG TPA: phytoene/squalene synthase family protein [Kaistiaceae bacterium]|nr:phytoene/squalene synthase family protein [Kaistiaceae bacterium]
MSDVFAHCQAVVRRTDADRFFASLYAPAERRQGIFALYAFNTEIARVRELVTDPYPGEMRYQWWRDTLSGVCHGHVEAHPVAAAMIETVRDHDLPLDLIDAVLEARSFDLYDDPMETMDELEDYGRDTSAGILRLAAHVLVGEARSEIETVACHAGIAYAFTALLRALPFHSARRQLYLPGDMLADFGVEAEDVFAGKTTPELMALLAELRDRVRQHLAEMRVGIGTVPLAAAPAFLPIALVESYLDVMETPDYDPFRTLVHVPLWRRQWSIWQAARRARKGCRKAA